MKKSTCPDYATLTLEKKYYKYSNKNYKIKNWDILWIFIDKKRNLLSVSVFV